MINRTTVIERKRTPRVSLLKAAMLSLGRPRGGLGEGSFGLGFSDVDAVVPPSAALL